MRAHYKKGNIRDLLVTAVMLIIGVLFVAESITIHITLKNRNDEHIIEYQGEYEFYKRRYLRNTQYVFVLDNGDKISVHGELIENKNFTLESHPTLQFQYSSYISAFAYGAHNAISIISTDGATVFLRSESAKNELKSAKTLNLCIGCTCLALALFMTYCFASINWRLPHKKKT